MAVQQIFEPFMRKNVGLRLTNNKHLNTIAYRQEVERKEIGQYHRHDQPNAQYINSGRVNKGEYLLVHFYGQRTRQHQSGLPVVH